MPDENSETEDTQVDLETTTNWVRTESESGLRRQILRLDRCPGEFEVHVNVFEIQQREANMVELEGGATALPVRRVTEFWPCYQDENQVHNPLDVCPSMPDAMPVVEQYAEMMGWQD